MNAALRFNKATALRFAKLFGFLVLSLPIRSTAYGQPQPSPTSQVGDASFGSMPLKGPSLKGQLLASRGQRQRRARRRRRRRRRRRGVSASYRAARRRWHRRATKADRKAWSTLEPRPLVIRRVGLSKEFRIFPTSTEDSFDAVGLELAKNAFAPKETQTSLTGKLELSSSPPVHPRLLRLLHKAQIRFRVPYIYLISGNRENERTTQGSRHRRGRAADVAFPGVRDRRLAKYFRRSGFVGVGLYPVSGFVHVDVRRKSYFWIDTSAPGRRPRSRTIMRKSAQRFDKDAARRGVLPEIEESEVDQDVTTNN